MVVNITNYDDILLYTFNAQAVNRLSPYAGFRLPPLPKHMLSTFCYMFKLILKVKTTLENIAISNFLAYFGTNLFSVFC